MTTRHASSITVNHTAAFFLFCTFIPSSSSGVHQYLNRHCPVRFGRLSMREVMHFISKCCVRIACGCRNMCYDSYLESSLRLDSCFESSLSWSIYNVYYKRRFTCVNVFSLYNNIHLHWLDENGESPAMDAEAETQAAVCPWHRQSFRPAHLSVWAWIFQYF